jgi:hypothetical protein
MANGVVAKSTSRIGPANFRHTVASTAKTCFNNTAHGCLLGAVGFHPEQRRRGWAHGSMRNTAKRVAYA